MDLFDAGGRAFRARLKRELPAWREEGLVDERAAGALTERYRLAERGWGASLAAVYLLGALLVGGGVISFVAWNWEALPDAAKLLVLGGSMTAAHLAGNRLWKVRGSSPRLGHALVLLGTLIFGANIGLVAQIFHIEATSNSALAAFAAGAAAAGWAMRSVPNAILAVGIASIWGVGFVGDHESVWPFLPWLLAAVFLPLAWIERSRLLFAATWVGLGIGAAVHATLEGDQPMAAFTTLLALASLAVALPSAFPEASPGSRLAAPVSRLGFATWLVLAYLASFEGMADDLAFDDLRGETLRWLAVAVPALLGAIASFVRGRGGRPAPATLALVGSALLLAAAAIPRGDLAVVSAAHLALVAISAVWISTAVRSLERGPFWLGVTVALAVVVTRFFEYDTGLLLKAIVFVASGVAVFLVGIRFERRVRSEDAAHG